MKKHLLCQKNTNCCFNCINFNVTSCFRIAFIQFIQGSDLKQQMYNQLITNRTISPKEEPYMTLRAKH